MGLTCKYISKSVNVKMQALLSLLKRVLTHPMQMILQFLHMKDKNVA